MYSNKQKLIFFSLIFLLGSVTILTISINFHTQLLSEHDSTQLKTSATFTDIEIDALDTTNTSNSGNWTWAKSIGLCTGSGTPGSPYVIANHVFEYSSGPGDCLRIRNSRVYFRIRDCTFRNSDITDTGLYIYNTTNGEVTDCDSYDNLRGFELVNVNDTELEGNHIYSTSTGMYLSNSRFNTITNNNVSANTAVGIFLTTSMHNTITNNIANENQNFDGIVLNIESNYNDVIGNTVNGNGENGIYLDDSHLNTISNNEVNDNTQYGIYLVFSTSNNILSNTVNDNAFGILLDSNCDGNMISKNLANSNGNYGILGFNSDDNTITHCTTNHNAIGIYLITCDDSTISDNSVYNNTIFGICLEDCLNITCSDKYIVWDILG